MKVYSRYVFDEVKWPSGVRRLKCRACGKRFSRQRTFTQTINPFNKLPTGELKTEADILRELKIEAEAWTPDNICTPCNYREAAGVSHL